MAVLVLVVAVPRRPAEADDDAVTVTVTLHLRRQRPEVAAARAGRLDLSPEDPTGLLGPVSDRGRAPEEEAAPLDAAPDAIVVDQPDERLDVAADERVVRGADSFDICLYHHCG